MLTGLSAFSLTPMKNEQIDEDALRQLVARLAAQPLQSIAVLGSTGNYAYLQRQQRLRVVEIAVEHAGAIPVMVGIGALRTKEVLMHLEDAQKAGAHAVLLAPVSYQPLTQDEVYGLYRAVAYASSIPICVYDNPRTTHFQFTDELHAKITQLPHIASIKIPSVAADINIAKERIKQLRDRIPDSVSIGVSGDATAAVGLLAGCQVWYSVLAGLLPELAVAITQAAQKGQTQKALALSMQLSPLWQLFDQWGSLRVIATAAELMGITHTPCLPLPLHSLQGEPRQRLASFLQDI